MKIIDSIKVAGLFRIHVATRCETGLLRILAVIALFAAMFGPCRADTLSMLSPDGDLTVTVSAAAGGGYGRATFSVDYKGVCVLPDACWGLETGSAGLAEKLRVKSVTDVKRVTDDYRMLTGKRSHCVNKASERVFTFENESGLTLDVTLRVYDDGVAFKYAVDGGKAGERIVADRTAYTVARGTRRWMQEYDAGYERFFPMSTDGTLDGCADVCRWGYPGLVEAADSVFMLITEANIRRGHCGSYLYNGDRRDCYQVALADDGMPCEGAWESPWRLLIIGSLADVVESTLVTDVADPSRLDDVSWIKPGLVAWVYWAYNHGSRDCGLLKEYVDLATAMKWPYDLIDAEWDEMEGGCDIGDVLAYAVGKGVKPLVWYNSSTGWIEGPGPRFRLNRREDRVKEFEWLRGMGAAGVKIDFFSGDSVATMDYCIDLLEDAAEHKLMVNFHGATVPRGWQRTYPNLMSVEGVYGAEWYNNNATLTDRAAAHNATLPFTRNVIGPMDYTPGTFSDSQHPHITTHGHELALPVLFESAWQHMPDRPSTYYGLPEQVRRFLSELPTAWDDTRLLAGYPGVDAVIARRKDDVWYVAGINGTDDARKLGFSLAPLGISDGSMTLYKDGADGRTFDIDYGIGTRSLGGSLEVDCLPRGGFVAVISPAADNDD